MKSEFLGYETLIIFDDYNTKNVLLQNIDEVYDICKTLKNDDSTFEIEYQKKYQLENGEILYGEKKYLTIPNKSVPKLYNSTQRDIKVGEEYIKNEIINLAKELLKENTKQKSEEVFSKMEVDIDMFVREIV